MPLPLLVLALVAQAPSTQPVTGIVNVILRREYRGYSLCGSFTVPAPGWAPAYRLGRVVPRSVPVQEGGGSVRRGTIVLVADRRGGEASIFDPHGRGNEGCVPSYTIAPLPTPAVTPPDWAGTWQRIRVRDSVAIDLTIRHRGASLAVDAGQFVHAVGAPRRGQLLLDDGRHPDCPVRLTRLGPYLIASDRAGRHCEADGLGMSGVYRRATARR